MAKQGMTDATTTSTTLAVMSDSGTEPQVQHHVIATPPSKAMKRQFEEKAEAVSPGYGPAAHESPFEPNVRWAYASEAVSEAEKAVYKEFAKHREALVGEFAAVHKRLDKLAGKIDEAPLPSHILDMGKLRKEFEAMRV